MPLRYACAHNHGNTTQPQPGGSPVRIRIVSYECYDCMYQSGDNTERSLRRNIEPDIDELRQQIRWHEHRIATGLPANITVKNLAKLRREPAETKHSLKEAIDEGWAAFERIWGQRPN
ncbi:MAG: hypothetical protein LQ348_001921 [Seirophora lacunosa]|nr:MAG: hypothetical protein LQ348_001921 [Seirophora lacunosa]